MNAFCPTPSTEFNLPVSRPATYVPPPSIMFAPQPAIRNPLMTGEAEMIARDTAEAARLLRVQAAARRIEVQSTRGVQSAPRAVASAPRRYVTAAGVLI